MACSEGCNLLFHYPMCWRNFKEGCRALMSVEVEDVVLRTKVGAFSIRCHLSPHRFLHTYQSDQTHVKSGSQASAFNQSNTRRRR